MPKYIAWVSAFLACGRSTVRWANGAMRSNLRYGVPSQSPSGGRGADAMSGVGHETSSVCRASGHGQALSKLV